MKTLPHYLLEVDDTDELGIVETSYVEYPATGLGVYLFSKEDEEVQPKLKTFSVEGFERMTSGVLMMPDTKYLKRDKEGNLYTVEFKSDTLKRALLKYIKAGFDDVVKLEHSVELWDKKFVAVEHWIIEDENTKSPIFGHSLADLGYNPKQIPAGTIMKTTYVQDEEFWNEFILSGKINGYSLGGLFEMKEVVVTEEEFKAPEIKALLNDLGIEGDNITLTAEDGTKLKFGATITIDEEVANGEYTIQGQSFRVVEGVLVDKVKGEFSDEVSLASVVDTPSTEPTETPSDETSEVVEPTTTETVEVPVEDELEVSEEDKDDENVTVSNENDEKEENSNTTHAITKEAVSNDRFEELLKRVESIETANKQKDTRIAELEAQLEEKDSKNKELKNKLGKQLPTNKTKLNSVKPTPNNVNTNKTKIRVGNRDILV